MNTPEDSDQLDLKLDDGVSTDAPVRTRRGRWTEARRAAPDVSLKRRVDRSVGRLETPGELDGAEVSTVSSAATAEVEREEPFGKFRPTTLPTLQPNKAMDLLADVTDGPRVSNRRRRTTFRWTMGVVLVLGVGFLVSTMIRMSLQQSESVAPEGVSRPPRAPVLPPVPETTREEVDVKLTAALDVLSRYLAGDFATRQSLSLPVDPLPEAMAASPAWASVEKGRIRSREGTTMLMGGHWLVRVPVEFPSGDVRTAALDDSAGNFHVDWRSLTTAETVAWSDFLTNQVTTPTVFRVRLKMLGSDDNSLRISAQRSGDTPAEIEATVPRSARASQDWSAALARPDGLWADAWLRFEGPAGGAAHVRLVDITPEKWRP